jgi:hypothetical protein
MNFLKTSHKKINKKLKRKNCYKKNIRHLGYANVQSKLIGFSKKVQMPIGLKDLVKIFQIMNYYYFCNNIGEEPNLERETL